MKLLIYCFLYSSALRVLGGEVPDAFRALIVYQTPEEWRACVMSSHVDRLLEGRSDSPFVGLAPFEILKAKKILVSMPSEAKPETQPTPEAIFDAVQEYVLVPAGQTERAFDSSTDRWVEFTGFDEHEFRITFMSGIPVEVLIRKDKDAVVRFSLKKKPNQPLQTTRYGAPRLRSCLI